MHYSNKFRAKISRFKIVKYKTEGALRDTSCALVTLSFCAHKQIEGIRKEGMEENIWRGRNIKLRKYNVNNLCPSIFVIIKLRRMKWVEHVTCKHGADEKCMREIGR